MPRCLHCLTAAELHDIAAWLHDRADHGCVHSAGFRWAADEVNTELARRRIETREKAT